jgi:hypothetical protein
MALPFVNAGMEQPRQLSCLRIDSSHIGSLVAIAVYARKSQIVEAVRSPVLFRCDVVDLKRRGMQRGW